MKQAFIHIGTPKTGTTSIQTFLETNRKHLASLGYLYPEKTNHHSLANCLRSNPRVKKYKIEPWGKLEKEIAKNNLDNLIISSEFFTTLKDSEIAEVASRLKDYKTKIIVYIKRQDKKMESTISQTIKIGNYIGDIETYLQTKGWAKANYWGMLETWSKYFGVENIIVRPLEKKQVPNLYEDFIRNINLNTLDGFTVVKDCNIKPNLNQLNGLKFIATLILKRLGFADDYFYELIRHPIIRFRSNYSLPFLEYTQHWQGKVDYNLISHEWKVKILEESIEQNIQIAKKYLNREDGILFDDHLDLCQHDILDFKDLTKDLLLDISSFLLQKQETSLKQEYNLLDSDADEHYEIDVDDK